MSMTRFKMVTFLALIAGAVAVGTGLMARREPPTPSAELPRGEVPKAAAKKPAEAVRVRGRVLDPDGKPIKGARLYWPRVPKTEPRTEDDVEIAERARSAPDGRFRLQGAGVERLVLVRLRAPGLTPAPLLVINRAGFDPAAWNKAARDNMPPGERRPDHPPLLYGPKIEYVAPAGRRIEGTARESGSGKPVPGYRVFTRAPNGFDINAVSDKEGKYKLLGVPKMKQYLLFALPPVNSAWLPTAARGEDAEGLRTLRIDFTVARGILVSGRILDRATGKGVRGGVRFVPLPGNKYFGKPGYDYYKYAQQEQTMTDLRDAGRYRLAVLPGPGVLMVQARGQKVNGDQTGNVYKQAEFDAKDRERFKIREGDEGERSFLTALENHSEYLDLQNAVKVLDLAADAGTAKCDVFLERGATRTVQIEDGDGKLLKGTIVAGVTATWPTAMAIKDATCTVFALDPKKPRRLFFFHAKRHLAEPLTLRGDEKEAVVVGLKPTGSVIGRVLDRDGRPLAGAEVIWSWLDQPGSELYRVAQQRPTARTDKDGRFRFEGIVPEEKFTLGIVKGRTFYITEPSIGAKQIKLGETLDLGDVRVKPRS
jgi:hypothetical protein